MIAKTAYRKRLRALPSACLLLLLAGLNLSIGCSESVSGSNATQPEWEFIDGMTTSPGTFVFPDHTARGGTDASQDDLDNNGSIEADAREKPNGEGLEDDLLDDAIDSNISSGETEEDVPDQETEESDSIDEDTVEDAAEPDALDVVEGELENEICDDGADNNNNGFTDCDDPDCTKADICLNPPEVCETEGDEDEDGLADCADPDCFGFVGCIEICEDQNDNDNDGMVDCEDPDCLGSEACPIETCLDFYDCLIEQGCNCTLGEDCPGADSAEASACQATCVQDDSCLNGCTGSLSPVVGQNLQAWLTCQEEQCGDLPADQINACINANCLIEYAQCFATGTLDCSYYAFECDTDCGVDNCGDICLANLSFPGLYNALLWNACRYSLCDKNADGVLDSNECIYIASLFVCMETTPSCVPGNITLQGDNCGALLDCSLSCPITEDECQLACLEKASLGGLAGISPVYSCILETCGTENLNEACIQSALTGACLNISDACYEAP